METYKEALLLSKESEFVVYAIEHYKLQCGKPGRELYRIFSQYGILDWLYDNYDVLHAGGWGSVKDGIARILTDFGVKS